MSTHLQRLDRRHPLRSAPSSLGTQAWREAGAGPALVLLHGIGSGALAWAEQLDAFSITHRVLAWEAPGYGESSPLPTHQPLASDYAAALREWLLGQGVNAAVVVGHSLGALMAAALAARGDFKVSALVLASPAQGYGDSTPEVRESMWRERVDLVERLGPQGMADARAARLCTASASAATLELVRWNMARVTPRGYGQAAYMLAHDRLRPYAAHAAAPMTLLNGELDTITPVAASQALARDLNAPLLLLPGAAHACYVEHPRQFNAMLTMALQATDPHHHD